MTTTTPPARLFLPCAAGVEALLAEEATRLLPDAQVQPRRGGVAIGATLAGAMRLNLESRLAQRVLVELAEGPYRDERDLYTLARRVDWTQWIGADQTLRVDVTAQRSPLKSLNFAALTIKDAIVDQQRERSGARPSVDTRRPDLPVLLHVDAARAIVYADTSGEALFKRGWREDTGDAPLKETLAAALLAAAGWRGTPAAGGALNDPCCGAGTIAIEAATIACGIAPGIARGFAFERLLPFADTASRAAWQAMKADARRRVHASAVPIFASDVSHRMVDFARRNAARAEVAGAIEFHGGDALERPAPVLPPDLPGTLMLNPPYGQRIEPAGAAGVNRAAGGRPAAAEYAPAEPVRVPRRARDSAEDRATPPDFFARLAAHWKRAYTTHPAGWTAWVLSPDMALPGAMRLKASLRMPLWNGPIECRLYRFELVAGSARRERRVHEP